MSETFGKTYKQTFAEWKTKQTKEGMMSPDEYLGAEKFARFLDSFQVLTPQLQVLAMTASREIDREVLSELIAALGVEKATPIIKRVHSKHRL